MPTYIEYNLGDNTTILIETIEEEVKGIVKTARKVGESPIIKAKKTFPDAFQAVKQQAILLLAELDSMKVDEAEIKFGINTVGEVGNLAIGKLGVGVNYEVTLKWTKPVLK
ncbi:MAG TPA: CU044_2847 family protein [Anaerolineales bacterium]|nr:CU044_2847 family protein [Anaerolineales bacterium]